MTERHLSTIFLLGAGSSKPAGLSTITELTSEFVSDPIKAMGWTMYLGGSYDQKVGKSSTSYDETVIREKISYLAGVTKDFFKGKMDLELLMSIILRLKDENERKLFHANYPELKQINDGLLDIIKNLTESYIRKKCENIQTIDYLWPLQGLTNMDPMEIFTLNYDATVEIFCEKKLTVKYGSEWWEKGISQSLRDKTDGRKNEEAQFPWKVSTTKNNLEYLSFPDLSRILLNQWDTFNEIFKDQSQIELRLKELEEIRNAIGHSRTLTPDSITRLEQYSDDIFKITKQ